jgi:hypothetical protein
MVVSRVLNALATLSICVLELSITAAPAAAQAGPGVTGWWAGAAPDSGITYNDGTCSQDVTFVLQQQGGAITGELVAASTASGSCQFLRSVEQAGNTFSASEISGSVSQGELSLTIQRVRSNNGVPNQVLHVVATGAIDPDRLTLTGNVIGPRTWIDRDGDAVADCDLGQPVANGECGAAANVTPMMLSAVRLDSPAFLLDFETAATGADIVATPLVVPEGTVTATAEGGQLLVLNGAGGTGRILLHDQSIEGDYGQLAFDFEVSSITFNYDGFSAGEMLVEVLGADLNVLGTFFDPDTDFDFPGGPVTLSAPAIRYLRWGDTEPSKVSAGLDNVSVSVAATSPVDRIDEIADILVNLTAGGFIEGGAAQSLATRLRVAASLAAANPNGAVGVLTSFINQVDSLVRRGILSATDGQALITAAQEAIAALQG